jgi:hypothetical protein
LALFAYYQRAFATAHIHSRSHPHHVTANPNPESKGSNGITGDTQSWQSYFVSNGKQVDDPGSADAAASDIDTRASAVWKSSFHSSRPSDCTTVPVDDIGPSAGSNVAIVYSAYRSAKPATCQKLVSWPASTGNAVAGVERDATTLSGPHARSRWYTRRAITEDHVSKPGQDSKSTNDWTTRVICNILTGQTSYEES